MRWTAFALLLAACAGGNPTHVPSGWRLLLDEDFEGAPPALAFSDPDAFEITAPDGGRCLELARNADYEPPVRSPRAIALFEGWQFGDFMLEADLKQTGEEYAHRDLCLFFGFEAPDRFYYLHLASRADPHAHNLFLVNGAPRTAFAEETTSGVEWGDDQWHRVRVLRRVDTGEIRVWFDDMEVPVMRGRDATFGWGRIGFGSFDDTGRLDNVRIWGPRARAAEPVRFH